VNVTWLEKDAVPAEIERRVRPADIVLDVGPGIRPQNHVMPLVHICLEPFAPYIERVREGVGNDPRFVFLNCTWQTGFETLPDKSVDSVFALDVIEHLEKEEGLELLRQARRVARRQVMIFTPLGYMPQDYDEQDKKDRWGMEGGYWQTHRSGWEPADFDDDWTFVACKHFHEVDQNDEPLDVPAGAFWAFLDLSPAGEREDEALARQLRRFRGMLWKRRVRRLLRRPLYSGLQRIKNVFGGGRSA
jgi:hypothetical protein